MLGRNLILILFACGLVSCSSQPPVVPAEKVLPVKIGHVEQHDVPIFIEAIGNVVAVKSVDIRPQVSGTLIEVRFTGGEDVEVGDILYRIDPLPYQLALEKAEATLLKDEAALEYAHHKVKRYLALVKSDFVSKLSIEEYSRDVKALEAQILLDKAEIGIAHNNLNYCTIVSPLKGRVNLSKVDVGNIVSPADQNPLTTILQISPIYVYFAIAQREFEEFQKLLTQGLQEFQVILPGSQQTFVGEVQAINNQVNLNTGTIQIKGIVANQEKILWPGEFVKVRVFIHMQEKALLVPASAVQIGQQGPFVYVLKPDQTVELFKVKTGEHLQGQILIEEGLQPDMTVITDGQINLKPGDKVTVINNPEQDHP